jgi:lipoate-protein ligase B
MEKVDELCSSKFERKPKGTMHGFAFNVNADLGCFDPIMPCRIRGKALTILNNELGWIALMRSK